MQLGLWLPPCNSACEDWVRTSVNHIACVRLDCCGRTPPFLARGCGGLALRGRTDASHMSHAREQASRAMLWHYLEPFWVP